jgi:hypothetical protein
MHTNEEPGAPARARRLGTNCDDQPRSDTTLARQRIRNFRRLRRRRWVERIHGLGCRPVVELVEDLLARGVIADEEALDRRLAKFAALDPIALAITGGDRVPSLPLHLVSVAVARP